MPIMAICLLAVLDMGLIVSPHGDSKIVVPCACGDCPNHSGCRVSLRPGTSDSPKTRNSSDRPSLPRMEPRLVKLLIYRPTADCEIGQIYVITSSKLGFGTRIVTIPTSVHDPARALILPTSPPRSSTTFPCILLQRCPMPRKAVDEHGLSGRQQLPCSPHIGRTLIFRDVFSPTSQR